jgi:large subunit ribosomal protein L25
MSSVIQLSGTRRDKLGKGGARKARAAGQIPGVLYGHGETPVAVAVVARDFQTALRSHKGGNALVNLKLEGNDYTALVRDAQYDPLSRAILHLDFQHISLTEQVEVEVELRPSGLAAGVKDGGGILEMIIRTIEVRCLPTAIPESILIDVTSLGVGDSLHVRDIKVEGVEILTDSDATVVTVVPPTVEEVVATPEGVAAAGTPEPEVVGAKGKKDEDAPEEKEKDKGKDKEKEKK